jgi:hypothetical protein
MNGAVQGEKPHMVIGVDLGMTVSVKDGFRQAEDYTNDG